MTGRAADLARVTAPSRAHTESDLLIYQACCAARRVDPLATGRAQVELYMRWMEEARWFRPSTVCRGRGPRPVSARPGPKWLSGLAPPAAADGTAAVASSRRWQPPSPRAL